MTDWLWFHARGFKIVVVSLKEVIATISGNTKNGYAAVVEGYYICLYERFIKAINSMGRPYGPLK